MKKLVFIDDIDLDSSPRVRAEMQSDTAQDYASAYKSKKQLPPPQVFQVNGSKHLLLADGRHRLAALKLNGQKAIACEVHTGTFEDCLKFALLANEAHGLRRTNADKRACVESAVKQWTGASSRDLAELCGVSHSFVETCRKPEVATESKANESKDEDKKDSSRKKRDKKEKGSNGRESEKEEEEKEPESVPVDTMGFPIPKVSLPFWERRDEIQELLSAISKVRGALKRYRDSDDQMLGHLSNHNTGLLDDVYLQLSDHKPDIVCPYCLGKFRYRIAEFGEQDCKACRHTGLVSKAVYDRAPEVFRSKRDTALKK
jgi:hypothetical protein